MNYAASAGNGLMLSIILTILALARFGDVVCYEDFSACWTNSTYVRLNNNSIDLRWEWRMVNGAYQEARKD